LPDEALKKVWDGLLPLLQKEEKLLVYPHPLDIEIIYWVMYYFKVRGE
jgi:hypothetical protein